MLNSETNQRALTPRGDGSHDMQPRLPEPESRRRAHAGDERLSDQKRKKGTGPLQQRTFSNIPVEAWMPRERYSRRYSPYRVMPRSMALSPEAAPQPRWRIELHGNEPVTDPILRLDIAGDTVLGRGSGSDVELTAYNAEMLGVSRRHALLRPTANHLYLIDLNSTNGTLHNATPVTSGIARPLEDNDVITLGKLIFTVKVLGYISPEDVDDEYSVSSPGVQSPTAHPFGPYYEDPPTRGNPEPPAPSRAHSPLDQTRTDHNLPDHIRKAAGARETLRLSDQVGSVFRRWFGRG